MGRLGIRLDDHRELPVIAGRSGQGLLQGLDLAVDHLPLVDVEDAFRVDRDLEHRRLLLRRLLPLGLRQLDLDTRIVLEGRGDHEEDQQQEHDVDQRG